MLAGWKHSGASGLVLVNGTPRRRREFKLLAGYVQQEDTSLGTLTVRENLMFSAELRVPEHLGTAECRRRVQAVIEELGLTRCAEQLVGNELLRGIRRVWAAFGGSMKTARPCPCLCPVCHVRCSNARALCLIPSPPFAAHAHTRAAAASSGASPSAWSSSNTRPSSSWCVREL